MILLHSLANFLSGTPNFTIIGNTRGGPPTNCAWMKDGIAINTTAQFNISTRAIPQNMEMRYQDSIYESSMTVVGRHPGMYQYSATNLLSPILTDTLLIEGNDFSTARYHYTILLLNSC